MQRPFFLTPLIIATALFMENLDSTIIATSLPAIALDLGESPISLKIALTSYLLSLAVFIPASGWAADRFGARTVFRIAIVVFLVGSILCGLSSTLAEFVGARIVQGMGGAMMVPVGRLVLVRAVPRAELVRALAYLTVPALIGPILGPPIGGFITTYLHWRWIFWLNIPIGCAGVVLASMYIDNIREEVRRPLDVVGFLLVGASLSALIFGLSIAGRGFLPPWQVMAMVAFGAALAPIYVWHARRTPHPILDLGLLSAPTYRIALFGGTLFRIGIGAIPFVLPLMLQIGFGLNPFQSGLLTFASTAGALVMKATAGPILKALGFRRVLVFNSLLASAFLASQGLFTAQTPHIVIIAVLLVGGFFRSLQFTANNAISFAEMSDAQMSRATSLSGVAQQLALSFGVAFGAGAIEITRVLHGEPELTARDFQPAFVAIGIVSALSIFIFMRLAPDAGADMVGRQRTSPVSDEPPKDRDKAA